jgi:predicted RND superfamily exporter protein
LVIAVAIVLALAGAGFALRLHPSAATSTFVSSSSPEYQATQRFYKSFGEEPIAVLVKGNLQQLVLSTDIERLAGLEGCLAGKVPESALAEEGGVNGPCGQLARAQTVKVVFGPGTFLSEAAERSDELLTAETHQAEAQAKQAEKVVYRAAIARGLGASQARTLAQQAHKVELGRFEESLATLALEYGLTARPSIEDANFVSDVVFDSTKTAGTPKSRFAYLFPSPDAALVSVRMKAGLSEAARIRTIALIRKAVKMPQWHLTHGESYLVTGEPVIVSDLTNAISHSIELLLIAVLVVMAATLGLVFSGSPRLLPLALALLAAALTFGALSIVGASLTMASIAVLPVLVGLAVDYAIQFQARVGDELERDAPGAAVAARAPALVQRAAALGAPTIAAAGAASAAAMLVLLLSPVPMVRGFGVLLVVGVAIALLCALTVGAAAISLSLRTTTVGVGSGRLAGTPLAVAWRGARELVADNPLTRLFTRAALVGTVRRPGRVLCVGLVLAALGWGLDTQTKVQTDITKLVPQSLGSLQSLNTLERITGVGGEIDVMIEGQNLTKLSTIEWMTAYQKRVLARFGYSAAKGCSKARLCPAFSLPDLFGGQTTAGSATGAAATTTSSANAPKLSQRLIDGLLGVIPPYFSQDVITPSRHVATLAFGIRLMSLDEQQQLIEQMRSSLHPPAGVHASLVGLPVLAAASGSQVADPWRRLETLLVGLAAVALVLLLAFRGDRRRALVPLVPIVMATGWSALILFAVRVPLNPMSVTLGALVIAISTEFSVLLSERHRQERLAGYDTIEALRRSYRRTGAAVAASGATATMGFGVLVLSEITMLRDFGLVTLIDLSVSLVGVLLALPATLVIADAAAEGGRDQPVLSDLGTAARRLRGVLVRS